MKSLSLSKSRDYLNESTKQLSRAQEKFSNFKTISKSQEVLSPALGGNMKRMVAGAVSDIPAHNLPINPRVYLDTQVGHTSVLRYDTKLMFFLQADCSDFVMVPGSSVLMSHSELMAISGSKSSGSLQLLPISESKAGSPAPSEPCNDRPGSRGGLPPMASPMVATVKEEEEEDVEVAGRRDEASQARQKQFKLCSNILIAGKPQRPHKHDSKAKHHGNEDVPVEGGEEPHQLRDPAEYEQRGGEAETQHCRGGDSGEAEGGRQFTSLNSSSLQVDLNLATVPAASPSPLPPSSRGATPTATSPPPPPPPALPVSPGSSTTTLPSTKGSAASTLTSSNIPTEGNIRLDRGGNPSLKIG